MTAKNFDLVVIGGGIAGMVTGTRAAQLGRKVVVLERLAENRYLNNTRLTGGVFHCALNDVRTPPEELSRIISHGGVAPDLAQMMGHNAKRAVEWLQSLGIRFVRGSADPWHSFVLAPPNIAQLGRNWEGRAGDVLLRSLEGSLVKLGGVLLRGHEAKSLRMEDNRCVGVAVDTPQGMAEFSAKAVVLADGGFQSNKDLISQYITQQPDRVIQRNAGSGIGAGLRMAIKAGAAVVGVGDFYGHVLSRDALVNDMLWPYPWLDELLKNYMVVGADGRRFANEGRGGVYIANRIAKLNATDSAYVLCDEAGWNGAGKERFLPPNPNLEKAGATIFRAHSLEALAAKAGIGAQALHQEVHSYNAAIAAGQCEQLSPERSTTKFAALPIEQAPFYAIPVAAGITNTMGGVCIDAQCRVQAKVDNVIVGLYAVGGTTGGLEGGSELFYMGGLVKATVTALVCAESFS